MINLFMGTLIGAVVLFAMPAMGQWRYTDAQGVVKTEQYKSGIPADYRDTATWVGPTGTASGPTANKCKQADGTTISIPGMTIPCPTPAPKNSGLTQAQDAQLRIWNAERQLSQYAERDRGQQGVSFVNAANLCNRRNLRDVGAVAKPDGTVKYVGTVRERFDFENCMEKAGFPLTGK